MVTMRLSQQQSQGLSTAECTGTSSAQSAPARVNEDEINSAIRGQRRGHMKGVGRLLKGSAKQAGSTSSTAAGSSTSVPAFASSQAAADSSFTREQMQGMFDQYHQMLQATLANVLPGFQLPPVPHLVPPPRPDQADQQNADDSSQENDGESPGLGDD